MAQKIAIFTRNLSIPIGALTGLDGKNHLVRGKLSQIKEELPPNFTRCHRSYIVNANFIKQVNNKSISLLNKEQFPLGRSHKNKFL